MLLIPLRPFPSSWLPQAPCFLFVDEIDALAGKSVVRNADREAVFREFLNELDGR